MFTYHLHEGEQVVERSASTGDRTLRPGQRVRTRPSTWAPAGSANSGGAKAEDAAGAMTNAMGR